jgi:hypothetical protein
MIVAPRLRWDEEVLPGDVLPYIILIPLPLCLSVIERLE